MMSTATPRVQFAAQLATPEVDRPRRTGVAYPKVAQSKGDSGRKSSIDLFWRWSKLSSVTSTSILDPADEEESLSGDSNSSSLILFNKPISKTSEVEGSKEFSVVELGSRYQIGQDMKAKLLGVFSLEVAVPSRCSSTSSGSSGLSSDTASSYTSTVSATSSRNPMEEGY